MILYVILFYSLPYSTVSGEISGGDASPPEKPVSENGGDASPPSPPWLTPLQKS